MSNIFDSQLTLSFRIGQTIMEAISIVCVNSFLIISGWYGVKLKLKSLWKIYILLVSIYIPVQMIDYLLTGHFSIVLFIDNILAFTRESYFVQCYLMLVFLSPIINSFIEKYKKNAFQYVMIFWFIEFVMDIVRGNECLGFNECFSLIHFILLYMMSRVTSLYKTEILTIKPIIWILIYLFCIVLICICHIFDFQHTWSYSNPIIIVESFCLFFIFLYKPFYSK